MNAKRPRSTVRAGVVVASPARSNGKTILSVGLAGAASERGLVVQTFKKGPDYIDPLWLARASGRPCYNLDPHLQSTNDLIETFRRYADRCDLSVVEGSMGLHDGLSVDFSDSNAALARRIALPVLLVIDATGMNRTVAAIVNGLTSFDADVSYRGIVLTRVKGTRVEAKLRRAVEQYTDFSVLGALPEADDLRVDERELGLVPAPAYSAASRVVSGAIRIVNEHCDVDTLLPMEAADDARRDVAGRPEARPDVADRPDARRPDARRPDTRRPDTRRPDTRRPDTRRSAPPAVATPPVSSRPETYTVGVARDAAFQFYYADDLDALASRGVRLVDVSPLAGAFPAELDGLIIGGGFPERFASELAANEAFKRGLRVAIESGLAVHAECGGLMYLCCSINVLGQSYPMANVLDADIRIEERPVGRGYMRLAADHADAPALRQPTEHGYNAHEFHYSTVKFRSTPRSAFRVIRGVGIGDGRDGVMHKNVLASYAHFRNSEATPWVDWFIAQLNQESRTRGVAEVLTCLN